MEGVVRKFKQGARGFVRVSDEVLVKARRLGMYGASELIAQRLRSLAQSSIPVAHGAFNFRKDMWLFRIEDNQVLDLNLLTPDNTLKSETGTYRQKRARLSRERGTAGPSARPSPAEQEAQNGPVTGNDARSDGSHSVGNLQSRGRQISTEERNKTIREIFVWRSKHLDKALEALANAARQYADELIRDDKLHAARLRQRRENMFVYIRLARELMADWPITDEDVFTWIEQQKWLKLSD